jgi:hypothetical protein
MVLFEVMGQRQTLMPVRHALSPSALNHRRGNRLI